MAPQYDILVVGGGCAGSTAALYAARAGRKTLLLDRGVAQSNTARMASVVDLPAINDRTSGESLIKRIRWQAKDLGAEIRDGDIRSLHSGDHVHTVQAGENRKFDARIIILATGCGMPSPTIIGESDFVGRGVVYSLVRDMGLLRKRPVAVIGKTAEAAEAVRIAARIAEQVTWLIPTHKIDLPDGLFEQIKALKNVTILTSTSVKAIMGDKSVEHVVALSAGSEKQIPAQAVVIHHPVPAMPLDYLAGLSLQLSPHGYPLVSATLETSIRGIFACGDMLCGVPQLPTILQAQGMMAALGADQLLDTWKLPAHKSAPQQQTPPQAAGNG